MKIIYPEKALVLFADVEPGKTFCIIGDSKIYMATDFIGEFSYGKKYRYCVDLESGSMKELGPDEKVNLINAVVSIK